MTELVDLIDLLDRASANLKADGAAMLRRAREWEGGPGAQRLDAARGGAGDPTAAAVGRKDPPALVLVALDAATDAAASALRRVLFLHATLAPPQPVQARTVKERKAGATEAELEGWCRSCWRVDQCCTPIETRKDGVAYYRGLCRWCGAFQGAYKRLPPVALVRRHQEGRKISEADVQRALRASGTVEAKR